MATEPKRVWTCPCGHATVKFYQKKITLHGAFLRGNLPTHAFCKLPNCSGSVRVALDFEFYTPEGEMFHCSAYANNTKARPVIQRKTSGKKATRRTTRKSNPRKSDEQISFKFLD